VKYWEIITDRLSKAGWSWGRVSALELEGRKRFIVRADKKLTAFIEVQRAIHEFAVSLIA
jgi:hypothetical protein